MSVRQTYGQRAKNAQNPAAKLLLEIMERKKTNLSVSVDVVKSSDLLAIIDTVGPYVCLIKTHIDIVVDFDFSLIEQLEQLSRKHDFIYFEDRKFADIGNTVAQQYAGGIYKIASWAHITNAHAVPGPSIIQGLSSIGLPLNRGLLLLAEMSTAGSLAVGSYTKSTVEMARENRNFVIGFVAQSRLDGVSGGDEDFLIMTPGVSLESAGDLMGQQYRSPRQAVLEGGSDIIIVGRGIYGAHLQAVDEIAAKAERYKTEGWKAYLDRLG